MRFPQRAGAATAAVLTAAIVAACGGSSGHWLSAAQANQLTADLNNVSTALDSGSCSQAQQYLRRFQSAVSSLNNVNSTLVANLNQGVSTVESLASSTCHVSVAPTPKPPKRHTHTSTSTTPTQTVPAFTNTDGQPTTSTPTQPTTSVSSTSTTGGASPVTPTTATTPTTTAPGSGATTTTPYTGPGTSGGG